MKQASTPSKAPHFTFITLFPDAIKIWLTTSILGRAHSRGLFTFETLQLRDFATDRYRSVDDSPYGGGDGMVLRIEPLVAAIEHLRASESPPWVVHFTPCGKPLNGDLLEKVQTEGHRHFAFICGHYEGIDQRFVDAWVDLEVAFGDVVLTGGELPAVAMADALIRKLSGTLASEAAHENESFSIRTESGARLLEHPHYTRPAEFRGMKVPDVLLSGDHAKIAAWRNAQSLSRTQILRPDLLQSKSVLE